MTDIPFVPRADAGSARTSGLALRIRHFTPNWFAATMGTGGLALVLANFPLPVPGLGSVAAALWMANIALFGLLATLYAARWLAYPGEAARVFHDPVGSMFLGTIPMGLSTIVSGFVVFGAPRLGPVAIDIALGLWWIDVALSIACGALVPFLMVTRQQHSLEKMTAIWLLPIVAAEVAASSGGLLAPHLPPASAYAVTILGYALWAYSVPLALSILVLLLLRLFLYKLPPRDKAASGWLALGPIGTGALGLLLLGGDAPAVFAARGLAEVGTVAYGLGIFGGLMLWGYGLWWLALALLKTHIYLREGMPFNLGWWGLVFPLAVYTLATLALGKATGLAAFDWIGGAFTLALVALWLLVAARTIAGAWTGRLFAAAGPD